jgi:hypothetical protein
MDKINNMDIQLPDNRLLAGTKNCINCLAEATHSTGHVIANTVGSDTDKRADICIIAGFCGKCADSKAIGPNGYFGEWRKEFGITLI